VRKREKKHRGCENFGNLVRSESTAGEIVFEEYVNWEKSRIGSKKKPVTFWGGGNKPNFSCPRV